MKMQRWFIMPVAVVVLFTACTSGGGDFKIAKSGMGYKIISGGGKDSLKKGDLIRFRISQKIEDSLLSVPEETPDQFRMIDSVAQPLDPFEIITKMAVGDSAICRLSVDSILKMNEGAPAGSIPAFLKKGKNIYVTLKILKKYKTPEEANPEFDEERDRIQAIILKKDSNAVKSMAEFEKIAKEKFTGAAKTKGGTLVQITKQGTGASCADGKLISMKYEGTFTDGTVFDGNIHPKDPAAPKTFEFVLGGMPLIKGWTEGLKLLNAGSSAKFLVPFTQAYGMQQYQQIPGYSNLLFEVQILDVKDAPQQPVNPGVSQPQR